jgi:hypothetical protein
MVWRSFVQARGLVCQSFDSSWCFISTKCGSSISAKFLIYGAQAVCFFTLVAILDPLIVALIDISQVNNGFTQFFICLVVISIPSLVECPFKSFAHLKIVFAYYCC